MRRIWILALTIAAPFTFLGAAPAMAAGRALTLSEYFDQNIRPGDVICDAGFTPPRCYFAMTLAKTLTMENDPSGMLRKGAVDSSQRQFTQVKIEQLMSEIQGDGFKSSLPIDVYVKMAWEAKDNGLLSMRLKDHHIIHGQLILGANGAFEFHLTKVLNQYLAFGLYQPTLDVAQVFGHQTPSENALIEEDTRLWMEAVLTAVVPPAYRATKGMAPKP